MKTYKLPCDWQISIPHNWQGEYDKEDGQCVFYPDNSDLTIRITPFHAERDGVPAPIEVMENAYIRTIPMSAKLRDAHLLNPDGFTVRMYEGTLLEEGKRVYVIYIGYYSAGELLSINVYGTNKTECEQALNIIKTVKMQYFENDNQEEQLSTFYLEQTNDNSIF